MRALFLNLATPIVLHNCVTVKWSVPVVTYDAETYVVIYGNSLLANYVEWDVI